MLCDLDILRGKLLTIHTSRDPDQTSDLGLHCLPFTLLEVSRLLWVNYKNFYKTIVIKNTRHNAIGNRLVQRVLVKESS